MAHIRSVLHTINYSVDIPHYARCPPPPPSDSFAITAQQQRTTYLRAAVRYLLYTGRASIQILRGCIFRAPVWSARKLPLLLLPLPGVVLEHEGHVFHHAGCGRRCDEPSLPREQCGRWMWRPVSVWNEPKLATKNKIEPVYTVR